jgi:hypothetical protein
MLYGPLEVHFEEFKRVMDAVHSLEVASGIHKHRSLALDTAGFEMLQFIQDSHNSLLESESGQTPVLKGCRLLSTLFRALRRMQAFDPRDLVFAFLAFQEDEGIKATRDSYRLTTEQVWCHAAQSIIQGSQSLDIFAAVSGDRQRQVQLPSWVPYWSDCFPYSRPIATPQSRFRASRNLPHIWKETGNPQKLLVRGHIVDRISAFPALAMASSNRFQQPPWLLISWEVLVQNVHHHLAGYRKVMGDQFEVKVATLRRDLMRTVLADGAMGSEQPLRCVYEMMDVISKYERARELRFAGNTGNTEEERELLSDTDKLENLTLVAEYKRVFCTQHIQLGMAPAAAQVGDQIAILHGSKTPCLLRETGAESGEYRIISQCYLDGWMYGKPPKDLPHPHGMWWEEEADEFILV